MGFARRANIAFSDCMALTLGKGINSRNRSLENGPKSVDNFLL